MTPAALLDPQSVFDPAARYPTGLEDMNDPAKAKQQNAQALAFHLTHIAPKQLPPLVIYHADCNDGLTAAWCVRRAYQSIGQKVDLYAAKYQTAPPDVAGRTVIIVDFSYKRPVLLKMLETAERIEIYDHHKSAQEDLEGLEHPNLHVIFDMERSGAGIAWDEFMVDPASGDEIPRPWFVNHVEHNDLWRHANPKYAGVLPECKEVMEYIRSFPASHHFTMYDLWMEGIEQGDPDVPVGVPLEGKAILRAKQILVDQSLTFAQPVQFPLPPSFEEDGQPIGNIPILVCNVPFFLSSEVAGALAKLNRDSSGLAFGVSYYRQKDGRWSLSFRSEGDLDVSKIAQSFGGGGHRNAAGATVDRLPWDAPLLAVHTDGIGRVTEIKRLD